MRPKEKRMQDICIKASRDLKNFPGVLAVSTSDDSLLITITPGTKVKPILEMIGKYKVVIRFEEIENLIKAAP
jgi:hypothetical protein